MALLDGLTEERDAPILGVDPNEALVRRLRPGSREYDLAVSATNSPRVPDRPILGAVPRGTSVTPGFDAAKKEIDDRAPILGNLSPPSADGILGQPLRAQPAQPEGPATAHYRQMLGQGPPQYHGVNKVLDILGNATSFGQAIESGTGLGSLGYRSKLGQAEKSAQGEGGLARAAEDAKAELARTADTQSQTDLREAQAKAAGQKDEEALAKIGMKRNEQGAIVPDESSEIYKGQQSKISGAEETNKNLNAYRQAQTDLAQARTEAERAKNDPNSPAYQQAQQKLQMAQRAHDVAAENLGLHQAEFQNRVNEQELVKPSGQTQSRGSAATSALKVIPSLEKLTLEQAKSMGPLVGRIARGELKIGNVDPGVAELYGAMKSFYALQPAVHGFRNAEFVKDFETALGTLERNPEAFLAGIKGLRPTLEAVQAEGKTYHQRIVEGRNAGTQQQSGGGQTFITDVQKGPGGGSQAPPAPSGGFKPF